MNEQKRQEILASAVRTFGRLEWFRNATVFSSHPNSGAATIEFKVNYIPLLQKKEVIAFAQDNGLEYFFTVVDRDGNKIS